MANSSNQINAGNGCGCQSNACDVCCEAPETILVENPAIPSTVTDLGNGNYLHVSGSGVAVPILADPNISISDNSDGSVDIEWRNGSVNLDICKIVGENCNASLVVNPDGSLQFTDNSGIQITVPAPPVASVVDSGNGIYLFDDGAGNTTIIDTN